MKFIHSRGVIHRDLKPGNILLDERYHPRIGDLGSSRFCDMSTTLMSGVGTPLNMAPEMYRRGDYTGAVDVYSFSLIVYEMFVGVPVFDAAVGAYELMSQVASPVRPPLPESMDWTVQEIIRKGWSVDPVARGSFEDIFEALRRIGFKMKPAVNEGKVSEFVALVDPCAAVKQANQFPPSVKKGRLHLPVGGQTSCIYDIPDGIIAHLVRECGGNLHNRNVVEVTSSPLLSDYYGAKNSETLNDYANNVADLETSSCFQLIYRYPWESISHTGNNWILYDSKDRRIVPTHYAIRTIGRARRPQSEIVARRDVGGRGELAGSRQRGGQQATQRP
jgi:serine/threonine protein kinase